VLATVQKGGRALQYASNELKGDRDIVLAVQENGHTLQYASEELRDDHDIMLAANELWSKQCNYQEHHTSAKVIEFIERKRSIYVHSNITLGCHQCLPHTRARADLLWSRVGADLQAKAKKTAPSVGASAHQ
jgi:hypothetical protein